MAQTWTSNTYQADHVVVTDMQNIEDNFATLHGNFSGASQPSNAEAGMPWFDTSEKLLKIRNQANSAWLGVMYGNSNNKIWMYSNAATDGWVVDSSLTDRVLAIKGGSAAYNVNGGNTGGTWTQPAHQHAGTTAGGSAHSHIWITRPNDNYSYNSGGSSVHITPFNTDTLDGVTWDQGDDDPEGEHVIDIVSTTYYTSKESSHTHTYTTSAVGTIATYRPAAAVGTLQYPHS